MTGTPTATVAADQIIFGGGFDAVGQHPGIYFNPSYGSPLVHLVHYYDYDWTLENAGTIWNTSTQYTSTAVWVDRLVNSGLIVAEVAIPWIGEGYTHFGSTFGAFVLGGGPMYSVAMNNSGSIFALATGGNAFGVYSEAVYRTFVNSGLIAAQSSYSPSPSTSGGAWGVRLTNGATLINEAGGQILAEGPNANGVFIGRGLNFQSPPTPQVINYGLIEAVSTDPGISSRGIYAASNGLELMEIENGGTIRADIAIYAPSSSLGTFTTSWQINVQTVRNLTGGVIEGRIELHLGADVLINQGTITGTIDMGDGDDRIDSTGGTINGLSDLGFGNDHFIGGNGVDTVMGQVGNDTVEGGGGNDLLIGGFGDDVLIGGGGNDGMYGEAGDDRFVLESGDVANGGLGHDRFETIDYRFARLDGESGNDSWILPAGPRILSLSAVTNSGRVTGIERIELSGNKTLIVAAADVAGISGSDLLTIDAESSDTVRLVGAWTKGAEEAIGGITYIRYTSGTSAVLVDMSAGIVLNGAADGAAGLDPVAAGGAPPIPGSMTGAVLQNVLVLADHLVFEDLVIGPDETWISPDGRSVLRTEYGTSTRQLDTLPDVVNHGVISSRGNSITGNGSATAFGPDRDSISVMGHFTNTGTIEAIAENHARAFFSGGRGTLSNSGKVHAIAGTGDADAIILFGSAEWPSAYSIVNEVGGDIYARSESGYASGVRYGNAGALHNQGLIETWGGNGAVAVDMSANGGDLANDGTIIAFSPESSENYSIGAYFWSFASVVNTGVIAADIALYFSKSTFGQVDINNSGDIYGLIVSDPGDDLSFGAVSLTNSGRIFGDIVILDSNTISDTVTNTGLIDGIVALGGGNDVFDGSGGTQTGAIYGDAGNDTLIGGAGSDIFDGGVGKDTMRGGAGDDIYYVDDFDDVVTELAGEGYDAVHTALAAYVLPAHVEKLVYTGAGAIAWSGNAGDNGLGGAAGDDRFDMSQGGNDNVSGGGGDDAFFFGAALTAADTVDGGAGTDDQLGLQGDYTGANALTLGASTISGIELIGLLGGAGNGYAITTVDANVAGGQVLTVFGTNLAAGNVLTFNGAAETDGSFRIYGGAGTDNLTGGAQNDGFWFGPGRFDPSVDRVNGGGGNNDQLALDGDYTITLDGAAIQGIETVTLQAGPASDRNSFDITVADSFVGAGQQVTIFGLLAVNAIRIDASAEHDGSVRVFGGQGHDMIFGSAGDDRIFGGNGSDFLYGGGGNDIYVYDAVSQSTGINADGIHLTAGDKIDFNFTVGGTAATVNGGMLGGDFDIDLAAAIGAGQMGAGQAVLFRPDAGIYAGQSFLIVDANGVAGYQAGQDYVIGLIGNPTDLPPDPFV
ncbi:beta strand repeat-containing protein [Sphingomonas sp. LT1P40]|uniref:beta strand repeat-containing protein n=1 Tax=Alteristakelama amylovorans TaxID=3096166 RepID=UPI002FC6C659